MSDNQTTDMPDVIDAAHRWHNGFATINELRATVATALEAAEARGRAEGYRAAIEKSRQFCARSGGCI